MGVGGLGVWGLGIGGLNGGLGVGGSELRICGLLLRFWTLVSCNHLQFAHMDISASPASAQMLQ